MKLTKSILNDFSYVAKDYDVLFYPDRYSSKTFNLLFSSSYGNRISFSLATFGTVESLVDAMIDCAEGFDPQSYVADYMNSSKNDFDDANIDSILDDGERIHSVLLDIARDFDNIKNKFTRNSCR